MSIVEYACAFIRPPRERLAVAAELVGQIPAFLSGAPGEIDLYHRAETGFTAAVVRAASEVFTKDVLARLGFWWARAGARAFRVDALPPADQARFQGDLARCDRAAKETPLAHAHLTVARFFGAIGVAPPAHPPGAHPVLAIHLNGPGASGVGYRPEDRALFVAGVLAPPRGDRVIVSARHESAPAPVEGAAQVAEVRGRDESSPGHPAGFTLVLEGPGALHDLLARCARSQPGTEGRAATRFPVKAPVKVTPTAAVPSAIPAVSAPLPQARVEYATEQELAADWIENLSHGGVFVRTSAPQPEGSEVAFELALPDGARLDARAVVAFTNAKGMGLRFVLSAEQDQILAAAIARISARPKRALVVDDDALARRMLGDALAARGFEVLAAKDANEGVHLLMEEILALDLFVTDLVMPGLSGEALVRMIRGAGGESDLAVVAVSARLDLDVERSLEAAGADAVLDKALGAELVAQAADAVLERKRLVRQADAA